MFKKLEEKFYMPSKDRDNVKLDNDPAGFNLRIDLKWGRKSSNMAGDYDVEGEGQLQIRPLRRMQCRN
uniref:Uncharacterized protein n=1 Tax=Nelumbo nucifera TaxID=4432 RepID=A0A822Z515_NELNU|nr:TPA_asm: hypothetical protein HUJ06_012877 [Nelumbo nucifera]